MKNACSWEQKLFSFEINVYLNILLPFRHRFFFPLFPELLNESFESESDNEWLLLSRSSWKWKYLKKNYFVLLMQLIFLFNWNNQQKFYIISMRYHSHLCGSSPFNNENKRFFPVFLPLNSLESSTLDNLHISQLLYATYAIYKPTLAFLVCCPNSRLAIDAPEFELRCCDLDSLRPMSLSRIIPNLKF